MQALSTHPRHLDIPVSWQLISVCLILTSTLGCAAAAVDNPSAATAIATQPADIVQLGLADDFPTLVTKGLVVVDFYATWCGPCHLLAPQLESVVKQHPGKLTVIRVDVDTYPQIAQKFQVDSIPFLIVFRDGKQVSSHIGYQDADNLSSWLGLWLRSQNISG